MADPGLTNDEIEEWIKFNCYLPASFFVSRALITIKTLQAENKRLKDENTELLFNLEQAKTAATPSSKIGRCPMPKCSVAS